MILDKLFGGIWKWVAAAATFAAGVLWFLYKVADSKRETAEVRAEVADANLEASERTRAKEQAVDQAKQEARTRAKEVEEDLNKRRQEGRRRREFGDPRLKWR